MRPSTQTAAASHRFPPEYLETFNEDEFKFRWLDGVELSQASMGEKHIASTLCAHMNREGIARMPMVELMGRTSRSRRGLQGLLKELELRGWIQRADVPGEIPVFVARLTPGNLDLLLKDRARRSQRRDGLSDELLQAVSWIELEIASLYGLDLENDSPSGWPRLTGALRSVVSRMPSPESDIMSLHRILTESPCREPRNVVGLMFKRLEEYRRANQWARHRK